MWSHLPQMQPQITIRPINLRIQLDTTQLKINSKNKIIIISKNPD